MVCEGSENDSIVLSSLGQDYEWRIDAPENNFEGAMVLYQRIKLEDNDQNVSKVLDYKDLAAKKEREPDETKRQTGGGTTMETQQGLQEKDQACKDEAVKNQEREKSSHQKIKEKKQDTMKPQEQADREREKAESNKLWFTAGCMVVLGVVATALSLWYFRG